MKKWKAYVQLYEEDRTWFDEYDFDVTDEQLIIPLEAQCQSGIFDALTSY